MKILITGATSSLCQALKPALAPFSDVVTAGRTNCNIMMDLNDDHDINHLPLGIDTLIHTAAAFEVKSEHDIYTTEKVNVLGTLKICQAAVKSGVKHFIFISSLHATIDPDSPFYNIYTLSKKQAEEIAKFYCNLHHLPLTILRPSQLYGNDPRLQRHQPFFYTIIEHAKHNREIVFYGSNDARRNYLHIDDLANIISRVVKLKTTGTYSCSSTKDLTYSEIAKAAYAAFKHEPNIKFDAQKPDILDHVYQHDHSLYQKINYYPQIDILTGMRHIAHSHMKADTA